MEEKITKKQIIPLVIGVLTLVVLVLGATYAYFSVTSTKNAGTTTITGDIGGDTLGTVTLSGGNTALYLGVSAYDMSIANSGVTYYSSTTEGSRETSLDSAGKTTYTATLSGDNSLTYACDYEFTVTKTGTTPNSWTNGFEVIFEGDINKSIPLINDTNTISGTWYGISGSDAERSFNAYLQLTNLNTNQNSIAGTNLSVEIKNTNWNCYLNESKELVGDAYAFVVETGKESCSLVFTRSETPITIGGTYEGESIEAVFTGIEGENFDAASAWGSTMTHMGCYDTEVIFEDTIRPLNTKKWFSNPAGVRLNSLDLTKLDTSNVIDMSNMFEMQNLDQITGLEALNVSKVTNMSNMFKSVTSNAELDLSSWDVSNVTDMTYLFWYSTLSNVNVSNWNLANVTSLQGAFSNAKLTNVNMTNWNLKSATSLAGVFNYVTFNSNVSLSNWNTLNVTDMNYMFEFATINTALGIETWNTSNVLDMSYLFEETTLNVDLDLSGWDVARVTNNQGFDHHLEGTGTLTQPIWPTT